MSYKHLLLFTPLLLLSMLNAKVIAKVPEASGICFVKSTKQLIVVNDEGYIYRLTTKGKIIEKKYLGDYDLEGIAFNEKTGNLLLVEEKKNAILVVDAKSFKVKKMVKIKRSFNNKKVLKKSKNSGLEAITVANGEIYLANQSHKFLFKIDSLQKKKAKIVKLLKHDFIDIAGVTFHNGFFYMTSDKKNLLIKYDYKNKKSVKTIKLKKFAQEGVCFDNKENLYIADDNGRVLKYKAKELGL